MESAANQNCTCIIEKLLPFSEKLQWKQDYMLYRDRVQKKNPTTEQKACHLPMCRADKKQSVRSIQWLFNSFNCIDSPNRLTYRWFAWIPCCYERKRHVNVVINSFLSLFVLPKPLFTQCCVFYIHTALLFSSPLLFKPLSRSICAGSGKSGERLTWIFGFKVKRFCSRSC